MLLCQSDVAPTFFLHPTSQTVALGDHLHLVVDAGGLPPPQFQWMHDGAALPGQTSAELYIPTFLPDTAGAYTCRAFNDVGSAVSNAAEVRGTSPERAVHACGWLLCLFCGSCVVDVLVAVDSWVCSWYAAHSPPCRRNDVDVHRGTCMDHCKRYETATRMTSFAW